MQRGCRTATRGSWKGGAALSGERRSTDRRHSEVAPADSPPSAAVDCFSKGMLFGICSSLPYRPSMILRIVSPARLFTHLC